VARYGGEEFAVILPHARTEAALRTGERLRRAVAAAGWSKRTLTISIGAGTVEGEAQPAALIGAADRALYRAKEGGRNQVRHASRENDGARN